MQLGLGLARRRGLGLWQRFWAGLGSELGLGLGLGLGRGPGLGLGLAPGLGVGAGVVALVVGQGWRHMSASCKRVVCELKCKPFNEKRVRRVR